MIVVFERDLRLVDHEALAAAAGCGPVFPVFILDAPLAASLGSAQKWWLHHSLSALNADLADQGGRLLLVSADDRADAIIDLAERTGLSHVAWTRRHGVRGRDDDARLSGKLEAAGLTASLHAGQLLHRPDGVRTGAGGFFKVYTPFWRAIIERIADAPPLPAPVSLRFAAAPDGESLESWALLPRTPDWAGGLAAEWTPGEAGAHERLSAFLDRALMGYGEDRNRPDLPSTSRLSPHIAFGEISPRQVVAAAMKRRTSRNGADLDVFLKEIVWREFAYHLLVNADDLANANFNRSFDAFPWAEDEARFKAWTRGLTGYPIVDAGMRELWTTGWMHNRVRMIVASFLCKHLLIDWRRGERWFWDTLVDADPASNAASWQWVAGSGADAAPYFRIFNPVLQGEKFDPEGTYVRRHVPELAGLPAQFIHKPWAAPSQIRQQAGLRLGANYPHPIIDHAEGRARALSAYQTLREAS
ncbi:MAG: DNA photolyase family protein [Rhizobiaceae bacterium]|nr:DNA photolyase family protein [Rhizobiaceae bacterium]